MQACKKGNEESEGGNPNCPLFFWIGKHENFNIWKHAWRTLKEGPVG